jgi:N-methylhydantoinase B
VLIDGQPCNAKVQQIIGTGVVVDMKTPGGGGYGLVADRAAADRDADLEDAYVSSAKA